MAEKKEKKILTSDEKAAAKAAKLAAAAALELRRERELALHMGGASYRQIADQISREGTPISKSTVEKDIKLVLDGEAEEDEKAIKRLRTLQKKRLNMLILAHMVPAQKGDIKKTELVRRLIHDLSELGGANKPIKFEHDHKFNPKELSDEELQRIIDSKS